MPLWAVVPEAQAAASPAALPATAGRGAPTEGRSRSRNSSYPDRGGVHRPPSRSDCSGSPGGGAAPRCLLHGDTQLLIQQSVVDQDVAVLVRIGAGLEVDV